jgi:L,D-peptidoglycan transpeptidase YkuD (ErfK/YbiS/YcfS/YnhG family)
MQTYSTMHRSVTRLAKSTLIGMVSVRRKPGDGTKGLLAAGGRVIPCALGRSGISAFKREGDGATPLAAMRLLGGYFRPDATMPRHSGLPLTAIGRRDGWCDAPRDANYNRPVRLPYKPSHEDMWRGDRLYDAVVVLDWNVRPRASFRGSAIFLHIARDGFRPTEGCVAIAPAAMRWLLPKLSRRTVLRVVG